MSFYVLGALMRLISPRFFPLGSSRVRVSGLLLLLVTTITTIIIIIITTTTTTIITIATTITNDTTMVPLLPLGNLTPRKRDPDQLQAEEDEASGYPSGAKL